MSLKEKIDSSKLPQHIAIIMDGNGRWAKKHGSQRIFGHREGVRTVRKITEACAELKVKYLTLYAFSTENWNRPKLEVQALMALLVSTIHAEVDSLMKNNIILNAIGNLAALPSPVYKELQQAIEKTSKNTGLTLSLALSYSSRWEIVNAVKLISEKVLDGNLRIDQIDQDIFSQHLTTAKMPDPELLIRTSGEYRISNYLLWQIAYSELYFTQKFWPEFLEEDLYEAIIDFQKRERRFGKTSEQI